MSPNHICVGPRRIGAGSPCFVIAEAGVNHDGSLGRALAMVDAAASAGADAVKFQTFDADRLVTRDAPKAAYQIETTGADESQYEMLARLQLTREAHIALVQRCIERGILFMSTPFDEASAGMLEGLGMSVFKVPSGEITNLAFLAHIARFGRPMIVSTGMASFIEVEDAVQAIRATRNDELALLHCVSSYPADPADANLRAMRTMADSFDVPVGYSDHTLGVEVALAAVALGACIIEKHFTLDRRLPGPDQRSSLTVDELEDLVRGIRTVESALGSGRKQPVAAELSTIAAARKSLVAACDIAEGAPVTDEQLTTKRPGTGVSPASRGQVVGRVARTAIPAGTVLQWEMLT